MLGNMLKHGQSHNLLSRHERLGAVPVQIKKPRGYFFHGASLCYFVSISSFMSINSFLQS